MIYSTDYPVFWLWDPADVKGAWRQQASQASTPIAARSILTRINPEGLSLDDRGGQRSVTEIQAPADGGDGSTILSGFDQITRRPLNGLAPAREVATIRSLGVDPALSNYS